MLIGKHTEVKKRGIYFLADDRVIELCYAFLNSIREHNPNINICLIPYNNNYNQLAEISLLFNFTIFDRQEILEKCDELSLNFHNQKFGHYRKLAIWEGLFDEFIYIDIDTVILHNLDFVFETLNEFDFLVSSSNIPGSVKWVWNHSIYKSHSLSTPQIEYAANTGFIASKKNVLQLNFISEKAKEASSLKTHMNLYCIDQGFINYLIVTSGKKYSSLNVLAKDKDSKWLKTERWAGSRGGLVKNGNISFRKQANEVLFLHWAGEWQIYPLERKILNLFRKISFRRNVPFPVVSYLMPYKKLWKHYRYLHLKQDK